MKIKELNSDQKIQLKGVLLSERMKNLTLNELIHADELVSDNDLEALFGGVEFVDDDFF